nr:vacuolar protein sorting-associated protein 45 homolog [Malus domestica]
MVLVSAVRDYLSRMLQDISGMKVLILDSHTVSIVSVAYSQSELLQKEVFLVELVDSISKSRESMSHLKAVYFLAPTSENIQYLRRHLVAPRFGDYHLFFSNILKDTQIHILADSDEHEVVQQLQVIHHSLKCFLACSFRLSENLCMWKLTKAGTLNSPVRAGFGNGTTAMVHELIGIQDNKVDLRNIGKFPKDQQRTLPSLTITLSKRHGKSRQHVALVTEQTLVQFLLKQAGVDKRTGDLFGNRDFLNIARNMARGLKGVENVYTQHQPLLFQTMESISKGRLRDVDYPFVGNHFQQGRPQDVVIFIVGGTTYEESRCVALQNAMNTGIRFVLGGSVILNSKRFLKDLEEAQRLARTSNAI